MSEEHHCDHCEQCEQQKPQMTEEERRKMMEIMNFKIPVFDAEHPAPECPFPWILDYTRQVCEDAFIKGDVAGFYDKWSDESKTYMSFLDLGRRLAQMEQLYGRFTSVGEVGTPFPRPGFPGLWAVRTKLFIDDIEFYADLSFNENKKIGDFRYGRCCIYHTPPYINTSRFEEEMVSEKPPIMLSKPTKNKNPDYPVAIYLHILVQQDINNKMGYCFPSKDLEYLPTANIGLLRSEFTADMAEFPDPVTYYASKLIEAAMMRDEISQIFLIFQGYASYYVPSIVKRFPGTIAGIILVNPGYTKPVEMGEEIPLLNTDEFPTDIPMLFIGSGYDQFLEPIEWEQWKPVAARLKADVVFYDQVDHFLISNDHLPMKQEYSIFERHMSDVPLRKIASWIREHTPQ